MIDKLTDRDLHRMYVMSRLYGLIHDNDFNIIEDLAQAWKESGSEKSFSDFVVEDGFPITGIPEFEHFVKCEMLNPRLAHGQVELIPDRWLKKLGMTWEDNILIHYEHVHAPLYDTEEQYRPGRF